MLSSGERAEENNERKHRQRRREQKNHVKFSNFNFFFSPLIFSVRPISYGAMTSYAEDYESVEGDNNSISSTISLETPPSLTSRIVRPIVLVGGLMVFSLGVLSFSGYAPGISLKSKTTNLGTTSVSLD